VARGLSGLPFSGGRISYLECNIVTSCLACDF
jgi:hypothetical protein